ncbi:MAG TPA: T9SS type A sorting domain-containing protein, partial [bacterium (Candidatus Stahlbacteria)]|nr:T9SS type A sorting domain-containing protein [Candidatus Stahlbacteria bacterium]
VHWGSTILQTWVPPTIGQMGAVRMLVNDVSNTAGGYMFNGACYMIAYYGGGTQGVEMAQTWHIFGDPSVQLRTDVPKTMTVSHAPEIDYGVTTFDVDVSDKAPIEDALCAIYHPDSVRLYGSGYTDSTGHVTIQFSEPLYATGRVILTVTGYNRTPYIDTIPIQMPRVGGDDKRFKTVFLLVSNPSNRIQLAYTLGRSGPVEIRVYDCQGRMVRTIEKDYKETGRYTHVITDLKSGVYFLKIRTEDYQVHMKVVLLR